MITALTLFFIEDRENQEHCELHFFVNYHIIISEKAAVNLKISTIFDRWPGMNKAHTFVIRWNIFQAHFVRKQPIKKSTDFMACSLSELQSSDLWEANNKTLSNLDSLGAGFSHVLISVSVSKNTAVASCSVQIHFCFLCSHLPALTELTIQYCQFPGTTDKKKQTALKTAAGYVRYASDYLQPRLGRFFFFWQRRIKEKGSSWKMFHKLSPFTA